MNKVAITGLAALSLLLCAPVASAQGTNGLHFGVEGGITIPQGDADAFDNGWHGGAMLVFNFPVVPLGLRFDAAYHRMDAQVAGVGDAEVLAGTADLVLGFRLIVFKPYVFGGVGYYRLDFSDSSFPSAFEGSQNETGWNAGAGVSITLRGVDLIFEGRYHSVDTRGGNFEFVPISVGVVF